MVINVCPITDYQVENYVDNGGHYSYEVKRKGNAYKFNLCKSCYLEIFSYTEEKRYIFQGLFLNDKLKLHSNDLIHLKAHESIRTFQFTNVSIKQIFEEADFPRSPQSKLDHLLNYLYKLQKFDGQNFEHDYYSDYVQLYFKTKSELGFYVKTLEKKGLLDRDNVGHRFSYDGILYYNKINEEGELSNKCFIAMAFDDRTKPFREAIKNALTKSGFEPVIIDEKHIASDRTINDEILVNIKRSKFVISDFTLQRNGVYFEAGYGLGLGKKVIYLCWKDDMHNNHFDVKPLQTIIYDDAADLENKLYFKIENWIK